MNYSRNRLVAGVAGAILGTLAMTLDVAAGDSRPVNPFAGRKDLVSEGASLLNQYCAHCHGFNGDQAERPRALKRLRIRYGDDAAKVFYETATKGRMDKGMPVWGGVLPDETLWKIYTFLEAEQEED